MRVDVVMGPEVVTRKRQCRSVVPLFPMANSFAMVLGVLMVRKVVLLLKSGAHSVRERSPPEDTNINDHEQKMARVMFYATLEYAQQLNKIRQSPRSPTLQVYGFETVSGSHDSIILCLSCLRTFCYVPSHEIVGRKRRAYTTSRPQRSVYRPGLRDSVCPILTVFGPFRLRTATEPEAIFLFPPRLL